MEDVLQPSNENIQEGRPPTPPRRCMPFIILSTTISSDSTPYVVWSPFPISDDAQAEHQVWFYLGHHSRPITPGGSADNHFEDTWVPVVSPPTPIDPGDLWDNLTIPYSAYFSHHETPPHISNDYANTYYWDQPVQNPELTPEPVPVVTIKPIAESSWNIPSTWREIDEWHLSAGLNWFSETQGRGWASETTGSDTATELLPKAEYVNGIHGESPEPSPILSIHSLHPTNPDPPLMTLTNAIQIYEMTRFKDLTVQIPEVLVQADYNNLFSYFAYELPFILAWVKTKAGNDYFMNQQRNLPSDEIL